MSAYLDRLVCPEESLAAIELPLLLYAAGVDSTSNLHLTFKFTH